MPLGKYCRKSPFVLSFVPRCHGERGSQKYTGIDVAALNSWWRAISIPWSQVSDRRRPGAIRLKMAVMESRSCSASCVPTKCTRIVNLVDRSTSVPMAD